MKTQGGVLCVFTIYSTFSHQDTYLTKYTVCETKET